MIRRAAGPFLAALLLACLVSTACAETTIDTGAGTSTTTTVAFEAAGRRNELLGQLEAEVVTLSERIIDRDGDRESLARIDAIWLALQTDLTADRPELVGGFQAVVDLARRGVERRRPADADKARLNLTALLTAAS